MATILDSNIILDVLDRQSEFFAWSSRWINWCAGEGPLMANAITFSEATTSISDFATAMQLLLKFGLVYEDLPLEAAYLAGQAHRIYRTRGGLRDRTLPDFLIGAHAAVKIHRVLTRDGTRYRSYFPTIDVFAPDTHA